MSNINLALQEQAEELGFSTVQEAIDNGYEVTYSVDVAKLIEPQEQAHNEWLKEKEKTIEGLKNLIRVEELMSRAYGDEFGANEKAIATLERAIKFIEGVSHE